MGGLGAFTLLLASPTLPHPPPTPHSALLWPRSKFLGRVNLEPLGGWYGLHDLFWVVFLRIYLYIHEEKLVLKKGKVSLPEAHGVTPSSRRRGGVGSGEGRGAEEAAGGPVVFPVASKKEAKWEVECAGCQRAGRPHHAPPPSLEAHYRPAPSLKAAAGPSHPSPVSCTETGKRSPAAVSGGRGGERTGAKSFREPRGAVGPARRVSPRTQPVRPTQCASPL